MLSGKPGDDAPVQMDAVYYDEVRRAIGRGTPTLLFGTSTRSLQRSLRKLKAIQQDRLPSSTATLPKTPPATATDIFPEHGDPVSEQDYSRLKAQANSAFEDFVKGNPVATEAFEEARRAHISLQEQDWRMREADKAALEAEQRLAVLTTKLDPTDFRILGFASGVALITLLVALNTIPLHWAAQAFRLDSTATWIMTLILIVASIGAMVGFDVTRGNARRRRLLAAVVAAGYLALSAAYGEFLTTMVHEPYPAAIIQAVLLSAISVGVVLCGSAVLARTRPFSVSRARRAVRHARRTAAEARAAQIQAAERLQRHIGVLRQMLQSWVLGVAPPSDVDRAKWVAVLERAMRAFFSVS
jgi:hypothetical protein